MAKQAAEVFQLACRGCSRKFGNQPLSICDECFSPLEVTYDLERLRGQVTRESIARGPMNMWRYQALLPVDAAYQHSIGAGFTPLMPARRFAKHVGASGLFIKNDAVCLPTLSFKDRVVSTAIAAAKRFGFTTIGCSSTGNLANAVAAQAAREGLEAIILVPEDLEAAKILNTQIYGARLVRVAGNYDHVNRLCSQIADRFHWGFVNVNLRPYYAEGSKTVGYEIAEQLGWRLPDNVVVPMAGGSLITKIRKAFKELVALGLVADTPVKFFGAQASGCSPISQLVKSGADRLTPQKPATIARSLAIGNPADGPFATRAIRESGGFAEDISDVEIVSAIQELAETEGIFAETAGGVTAGATAKLYAHGRIRENETTVMCITGNGLKTTDALAGRFAVEPSIRPRLTDFEELMRRDALLPRELDERMPVAA